MKLTESRIKQIILEEIYKVSDGKQVPDDKAQNKEQGEEDEDAGGSIGQDVESGKSEGS